MSLLNETKSVFGYGTTLHRVSGLPYAWPCHCLAKEDAEWILLFGTFYSLGPGHYSGFPSASEHSSWI